MVDWSMEPFKARGQVLLEDASTGSGHLEGTEEKDIRQRQVILT